MKIKCNNGMFVCSNEADITRILEKCANNKFDDIWINGDDEYPQLAILTNGEMQSACIHYFISDGDFLLSVGNIDDNGKTDFCAGGQENELENNSVIPLSLAVKCVLQFFNTKERPTCIEWIEL